MPCHLPPHPPKRKSSRKPAKSSESKTQNFFSTQLDVLVRIANAYWMRWWHLSGESNPTLYLSHHRQTPTKTIKLLEKKVLEHSSEPPSWDMKCLRTTSRSKPTSSSESRNWTSTIKSEHCGNMKVRKTAPTSPKSSSKDSHSCGVCKLGRSTPKRTKSSGG